MVNGLVFRLSGVLLTIKGRLKVFEVRLRSLMVKGWVFRLSGIRLKV
jgi:hypothetical protein